MLVTESKQLTVHQAALGVYMVPFLGWTGLLSLPSGFCFTLVECLLGNVKKRKKRKTTTSIILFLLQVVLKS